MIFTIETSLVKRERVNFCYVLFIVVVGRPAKFENYLEFLHSDTK